MIRHSLFSDNYDELPHQPLETREVERVSLSHLPCHATCCFVCDFLAHAKERERHVLLLRPLIIGGLGKARLSTTANLNYELIGNDESGNNSTLVIGRLQGSGEFIPRGDDRILATSR